MIDRGFHIHVQARCKAFKATMFSAVVSAIHGQAAAAPFPSLEPAGLRCWPITAVRRDARQSAEKAMRWHYIHARDA